VKGSSIIVQSVSKNSSRSLNADTTSDCTVSLLYTIVIDSVLEFSMHICTTHFKHDCKHFHR